MASASSTAMWTGFVRWARLNAMLRRRTSLFSSSTYTMAGWLVIAGGVCGQRAPGLRAADDGGIELPLCGGGRRRRGFAGAVGGVVAGAAAVWLSAAACAAAAKRRAGESQAGASRIPGGGVDAAAEETQANP